MLRTTCGPIVPWICIFNQHLLAILSRRMLVHLVNLEFLGSKIHSSATARSSMSWGSTDTSGTAGTRNTSSKVRLVREGP